MALVDEEYRESPTTSSTSVDWVNEVDRGDLWHVKEGTYVHAFYSNGV